jgi:hypothetical protein
MAHTRDTARRTETPANPDISSTPSQKGATKTAPRGKHSHEADDTATVESTQAKRVRTTTTSNPKRQREVDSTASAETELAAPTKKTKPAPKKMTTLPKKKNINISPRRSNRTQTNVPATPQRRKRRTREEIVADKAKADSEKRQKEELIKQNRRAMKRMDIDEDINRAEMAAQTIRTFADLNRETESDVEEFVGYHDVSSSGDSDSDSNGHTEKLKVSFLGQFVSQSTYLTQ